MHDIITHRTDDTIDRSGAATPDELSDERQRRRVRRTIRRGSFAVLATVSDAGWPHAAGVVYEAVGDILYVHTMRSSRKALNVAANPHVGVVIATRRIPKAPPFTVQFQGRAEVLDMDAPEIRRLLADGELRSVSGHGALDEPDGCFLRITPSGRIHSYGIGVSPVALARDPLHVGARTVTI